MPMHPALRLCVAMAAALALAGPAAAQPPSNDAVKGEIRALLTELGAALKAKDRVALERIYADEFLFIHALGAPVDKAAQIAQAMTAPADRSMPVPSLDRLMVFGDVAVLRSPEEGRFGTSIYVKRDGRWQVLQLQGTPTPLSRQSAPVAADLLRSYAGRYRQENGLFVTIAVEGDGLTLQVDGRQKLPLTSDSATQFTIPGGFGTITFTATQDGRVTYQIKRGDGSLIKGERVS